MIFLKWLAFALLDWLLLPVWYLAALLISLFTSEDSGWPWWAGWASTYDNPPSGDERWQRLGFFPFEYSGFKGYANRVGWLWRNPGYGFAKAVSVPWEEDTVIHSSGNRDISDKYKVPGYYLAIAREPHWQDAIAWELYIVAPCGFGKCLRVRLGWKIMTHKFQSMGFAPLVNTCNPFKSYG